MNLSFLPGQLYLQKAEDGTFTITIAGSEVFSHRSEKTAIAQFNKIRNEMETKFPPHELSSKEKLELLMKDIARNQPFSRVSRARKKKYVKGSTNTFG